MIIDYSFSHNYELINLEEVRPGASVYYYPGAALLGGRDGIIVQVVGNGEKKWTGIFAFGENRGNGYSGIYAMPSKDKFCIVSRGAGYIVSANDPEKWESIKSIPIIDVRVSVNKGIIIFSDYTELIAYGEDGIRWRTNQLSFDGLKLTDQDDNFICGEYFDIRSDKIETIKVNLDDGTHIGSEDPI